MENIFRCDKSARSSSNSSSSITALATAHFTHVHCVCAFRLHRTEFPLYVSHIYEIMLCGMDPKSFEFDRMRRQSTKINDLIGRIDGSKWRSLPCVCVFWMSNIFVAIFHVAFSEMRTVIRPLFLASIRLSQHLSLHNSIVAESVCVHENRLGRSDSAGVQLRYTQGNCTSPKFRIFLQLISTICIVRVYVIYSMLMVAIDTVLRTACLFSRFFFLHVVCSFSSLYRCCCCCCCYFDSNRPTVLYATLLPSMPCVCVSPFTHVVYFQFLVAFVGLSVAFISVACSRWFISHMVRTFFGVIFSWFGVLCIHSVCVHIFSLLEWCCRRWFDSCPVSFGNAFCSLFSSSHWAIRAFFALVSRTERNFLCGIQWRDVFSSVFAIIIELV